MDATRASYDEVITDLLKDLSAYYGKAITAENIHNESENATQKMYDFFNNTKYKDKWAWLKTFMIYCRENDKTQASGVSFLKDDTDPYANAYWRYEMWGFVNKTQRSSWPFSADYTNDDFITYLNKVTPIGELKVGPSEYVYGVRLQLESPVKEGFNFQYWEDENGNTYDSISFNTKGDLQLKAVWKDAVKAIEFNVINIPELINRFEELTIEYSFNPTNTYNQNVRFISSDENIFTVDKNGVIKAKNEGIAKLTIIVEDNKSLNKEFTIKVSYPLYVDIEFETTPYVYLNETIKVIGITKGYQSSQSNEIIWSVDNESIATISSDGTIKGISEGSVIIKAQIKGTEVITSTTVFVQQKKEDITDVEKFILSILNTKVFSTLAVAYDDAQIPYYYQINRGVSAFLFEDLVIDKSYMRTDRPDLSTKVEYITIHDTGNFNKGAGAKANIQYFQTADTSIHFTSGNDGVFQGVPLTARAAHAGDGVRPYELDKTNVLVTTDNPTITMIDGYFAINGEKTSLRPYNLDGTFDKTNYSTNQLTYSGIRCVSGTDGYYYLGKTYYNTTYLQVCNYGGNASSIGIESCINSGSDYYLTIQRTAKLVVSLLKQFNLTINDVKMHNYFSGKNCAQLMKNNSRYLLSYKQDGYKYEDTLYGEFLELIQTEYQMNKYLEDYSIKFISSDTNLLGENGRVKTYNLQPQTVSYKIEITSKTTGDQRVIESSIIIPSSYSMETR